MAKASLWARARLWAREHGVERKDDPRHFCGRSQTRSFSVEATQSSRAEFSWPSESSGQSGMDAFQGKASPNRPALGLPNGSPSPPPAVRLKLWRISLVNRLSAGRSGRI